MHRKPGLRSPAGRRNPSSWIGLACLLAASMAAQSAPLTMQTGNANLFSLAAHAACKTAVIVGSHGSLLVSEDNGSSWRSAGLNLAATLHTVSALPQQPAYLAVGTSGSVAYSSDCGRSWASGSIHESANLRSLIAADAQGSVLLAGADKGLLLRSVDGAQRWEERRLGSGHVAHLLRTSSGIVLAGGEQGLLASSRDAGQHWTAIRGLDAAALTRLQEVMPGLVLAAFADGSIRYTTPSARQWSLSRMPGGSAPPVINAFAANAQGVLLAATADGRVLRSTDQARTWQALPGMPGRFLSAILATRDGEFLLAGAQGTLARSRDQGANWRNASLPTQQEFETLQRLPDGVLVAAGAGGILARSVDDGEHWRLVREGVNAYTHMIAGHDGLLVAAGTQGSLARSDDGGESWHPVRPEDGLYFFSVVFEPRSKAFIAAGTEGTIVRSADGGHHWQSFRLGGDGTLGPLEVLPQGRVLALSTDRGILFSDDGGLQWQAGDANSDVIWQSAASDTDGSHIVAIGRDTLPHLSTDGGQHWRPTGSAEAKGASRIRFIDGVFLATGKEGEILRSEDGGQHFERIFLPVFTEVRDFEAFQGAEHGIVAVGSKGAILRSTDAGRTWQARVSGSQDLLRTIARDPLRGTLFVAGRSGPVLRSDDAGLSWQPATDTLDARISGSLATGREILLWGDRIIRLSE